MKRILFTGGSGKAGRHIVQYLAEQGHEVLNIDTKPLDNPSVRTLLTDITDAGQLFDAFASYTGVNKSVADLRPAKIDAVVHFAAIPSLMLVPDNETYRINVMSTYNVLDAATKFGVPKVIIASSETTYGLAYANTPRNPEYFPLDEDYPVNPMDSYALSKLCNERTGRGFSLRNGTDVYALRIGYVIEPEAYALFPTWFTTPELHKKLVWDYVDVRDLGEIVRLAIEKDGLGFQVFNAANDESASDLPTAELLRRYYPDVPVRGSLGEFESLLSNKKVRELLGFKQKHNWRKYVKANGGGWYMPQTPPSTVQAA